MQRYLIKRLMDIRNVVWFQENVCSECVHECFLHTQDHKDYQCPIWNKAYLEEVMPEEWSNQKGKIVCSKYKHYVWQDWLGNLVRPSVDQIEVPELNPNQLSLF